MTPAEGQCGGLATEPAPKASPGPRRGAVRGPGDGSILRPRPGLGLPEVCAGLLPTRRRRNSARGARI